MVGESQWLRRVNSRKVSFCNASFIVAAGGSRYTLWLVPVQWAAIHEVAAGTVGW